MLNDHLPIAYILLLYGCVDISLCVKQVQLFRSNLVHIFQLPMCVIFFFNFSVQFSVVVEFFIRSQLTTIKSKRVRFDRHQENRCFNRVMYNHDVYHAVNWANKFLIVVGATSRPSIKAE